MASWLNKQKKQAIVDLSREAGLDQDPNSRKDELVDALEGHLQENATFFSSNETFAPFFGVRRTPGRPRGTSMIPPSNGTEDDGSKSVVRARGRRATKIKPEPESEDIPSPSSPVRALAATTASLTRDPNDVPTHTPGRPRNSSRAQLPASPAQVAEYVEDHSQRFTASLNDLLTLSTLPDILEDLRINLSTVPAILLSCLALEAYGLFDAILPWKATGLAIPVPVFGPRGSPYIWNPKLPDLFMLLSPEFFWKPFLLWSGTSIFVPLFFAYFYNLTMRDIKRAGVRVTVPRSRVDPMTFSVVKMLVTMLVYGNGIFFGGAVDEIAAERVHGAVFGGYQGICVGAAVGAVASLYEAVQRK